MKEDVFTLTDIPVRHQVWTGWPSTATDVTMLASSGINYPSHELTVIKNTTATHAKKDTKNITVDLIDSDASSVEEFEDASETFNVEDDIFIDNLTSKKIEPLSKYY